jgi:DNA-directed RNA polymerase beta' subunit
VRTVQELGRAVLRCDALERTSIAPASVDAIRARAPKVVKEGATLDFRTLSPIPGGLFDYKVFGPGTVIDAPAIDDDEPWKPMKTQFGRLVLARPIVHPLIALHAPADVAERAGMTAEELRRARFGDDAAARRAIVERLGDSELVLRELAVLPPELRPLTRLADDRWQSSPLNDLYRRVIERNARLERTPADLDDRPLEAALLALYDNELEDEPVCDPRGRPLVSLRGLCGGNGGCATALRDFDAHGPTTARLHRIEAVTFALGFELVRT